MTDVGTCRARGYGQGHGAAAASTYIGKFRKHPKGQLWGIGPTYNTWLTDGVEPSVRSDSTYADIVAGDLGVGVLNADDGVSFFGGDMSGADWFGHPLGTLWDPSLATQFLLDGGGIADVDSLDGTTDLATTNQPTYSFPFPGIASVAVFGTFPDVTNYYAAIGFSAIVNGTFKNVQLLGRPAGTSTTTGNTIFYRSDPRAGSLLRNNSVAFSTTVDLRDGVAMDSWKQNTFKVASEAIPFTFGPLDITNVYPGTGIFTVTNIDQAGDDPYIVVTTSAAHGLAAVPDPTDTPPLSLPIYLTDSKSSTTTVSSAQSTIPFATLVSGTPNLKCNAPDTAFDAAPSEAMVDLNNGQRARITYANKSGNTLQRLALHPLNKATAGSIVAGALIVQGVAGLDGDEALVYDIPTTTTFRLLPTGSNLPERHSTTGNGGHAQKAQQIYQTGNGHPFEPEDVHKQGVVPCGGITIGSRLYLFLTITTLTTLISTFCPSVMLAYSDDNGETFTWPAWQDTSDYDPAGAAGGLVWPNDIDFRRFVGVAPVLHPTDGHVYGLVNFQWGGPGMIRVPSGSMLTKSAYEYWDGVTWVANSPGSVARLFGDFVSFGNLFYDDYSKLWVTCYPSFSAFTWVVRTAHRPEGPWSSAKVLGTPPTHPTPSGLAMGYGGFRHPYSQRAPNQANQHQLAVTTSDAYIPQMYLLEIGAGDAGTCRARGYGLGQANAVEHFSDGWGPIPMGVGDET